MVSDHQQHTSTTSTNLTAVRASAHVHVCLMFGIHRGRHKASERESEGDTTGEQSEGLVQK